VSSQALFVFSSLGGAVDLSDNTSSNGWLDVNNEVEKAREEAVIKFEV